MPILISDINQYDPTNTPMLTNIEVIFQSIHNIIVTKKGEIPFNLEYGMNLDEQLFELIDDTQAVEVFRVLTEEIEIWEPRIEINAAMTEVIPDPDKHKYELKLVFNLVGEEEEHLFEGSIVK